MRHGQQDSLPITPNPSVFERFPNHLPNSSSAPQVGGPRKKAEEAPLPTL